MLKRLSFSFIFFLFTQLLFSNNVMAGVNRSAIQETDFYKLNNIDCTSSSVSCENLSSGKPVFWMNIPGYNDIPLIHYFSNSPTIIYKAKQIYQSRVSGQITLEGCFNTGQEGLQGITCSVYNTYKNVNNETIREKITEVSSGLHPGIQCFQGYGQFFNIAGRCISGPIIKSSNPFSVGDPININNGSVSDLRTDLKFPLEFSRGYDSSLHDSGIVGYGWISNYDKIARLPRINDEVQSYTSVTYNQDGSQNSLPVTLKTTDVIEIKDGFEGSIYFQRLDNTKPWVSSIGKFSGYSLISDNNNNVFILKKKNGDIIYFDMDYGKIIKEIFINGSTLDYSYSNGLLVRVTSNLGQWLQFSYSDYANVITQVTASNGDIVKYNYVGGIVSEVIFNNIETVKYNFQGIFMSEKIDENGNIYTRFSYDENGNAISNYLVANGQNIEGYDLTYNNDSTVTEVRPNGEVKTHYFSVINGTTEYTGAYHNSGGNGYYLESNISYDNYGNVTSRTDNMGRVTNYIYNQNNYLISIQKPDGNTISLNWDEANNLLLSMTEPSPNGTRTTTYNYDSHRNVIQKTISSSSGVMSWTYSWTNDGRLLSESKPNGLVLSYDYYQIDGSAISGLLKSISTNSGKTITINGYDNRGNPTSITSNGITKTMVYDIRGRVLSETVGNATNQYVYDMVGNLLQANFANGYQINMSYDTAHRLLLITDNMGGSKNFTYDNTTSELTTENVLQNNALVHTKNNILNALGQITKSYNSNIGAAYTKSSILNDGSIRTGTDPMGNYIYRNVDRLGRTTTMSYGDENYSYTYDSDSNATSITVNNQTTNYNYDDFGRLVQLVSPDAGSKTYSYNVTSGTTTMIDANGTNHVIVKNLNGDIINANHNKNGSNLNETFNYDNNGKLTQVTDNSGNINLNYNALGLITNKTQTTNGKTFNISYGYDNAGQLTSITYPSGLQVNYGYTNGFVTSVTAGGNSVVSNVTYNSMLKLPIGWNIGSSNVSVTYNTEGALTGFNDSGFMSQKMSVDAMKQITTINDNISSNQYASGSYTSNHSLSYWETNVGWGYVNFGNNWNMTKFNGYLGNINWTFNQNNNQINSFIDRTGNAFVYSYDANGNTLSDNLGNYSYDLKNNMISSTRTIAGNTLTGNYLFNALNQRVAKSVNNVITYYVYNNNQLIGEYDSNGNVIAEYVYFGLRPVAVKNGSNINIVHTDYLTTPRMVTDSGGSIVWKWDNLDLYGNNLAQGNIVFNLRFAGQYFDAESRLHYNYYRTYNPATGRYMQSDPMGLSAGSNTYNYVSKNPMNAVDPLGLEGTSGSKNNLFLEAAKNPITSGFGYFAVTLHGHQKGGNNIYDAFLLEKDSELEILARGFSRMKYLTKSSNNEDYLIDGHDLAAILDYVYGDKLKKYKGIKIFACDGAKLKSESGELFINQMKKDLNMDIFSPSRLIQIGKGIEGMYNGNFFDKNKTYVFGYEGTIKEMNNKEYDVFPSNIGLGDVNIIYSQNAQDVLVKAK